MPRAANIFYNLVTDENSTTELLCNLMRFSAFRTPFLRRFLSEAAALEVTWEDFDTQVGIAGSGRPDIQIWTKEVVALIEVKVTPDLELTTNQPEGYVDFLRKQEAPECWLVFLVPKRWVHLDDLNRRLAATTGSDSGKKIYVRVIHWEDVVEIIERNDLAALNPFLNDFYELLMARIGPKSVAFTPKEIVMLFSNEIPTTLSRLQQLVDGVQDRSTIYKVKPSGSRSLYPAENGMYFLDAQGKPVFWFGVWMEFWKEAGAPLCFGLAENSDQAVREAFLSHYKGQTKRFGKHILGWFGQETLAAENPVDQVCAQLFPIVEATVAASS